MDVALILPPVTIAIGDDTGIDASGVAVPELQVYLGHRFARVDVDDLVFDHGVDALLVLADVAADLFARDVVGTLSEVRGQKARTVGSEQYGGVGRGRVAKSRLIVVSREDAVEVLLVEVSLDACLVDGVPSAGDVAGLNTAGLELVGTVGEVSDLLGGTEITNHLEFFVGTSGMRYRRPQKGQANDCTLSTHRE